MLETGKLHRMIVYDWLVIHICG